MSRPLACLDESWLQRLRVGLLTTDEQSQVTTHLAQCPVCAERVQAQRDAQNTTVAAATVDWITAPTGAPTDPLPTTIGRYPIDALLGRGGMGVVYRGRDPDLRRALAIKVLRPEYAADDAQRQRFLKEAQIMGQLQHPGVAPIHEIGTLPDGRPFFSMKQIQGQTFAALLKHRAAPADQLPTQVATFAQACQTVAYAHAQHILHRDLKPANVMVGAFGEVQVMDWGLAKVVGENDLSLRDTASEAGPSHTAAGAVLGTYAYMPPEQARGHNEQVDARSDVFGLGAMLCEILTGKPPYATGKSNDRRHQAARADLADALARLTVCGADAELIDLARRCLALQREQRPPDAGAVAEALAQYQSNVQQRLRRAELDRAAAQVKAAEERKRRKVSVALYSVALALVLAVSGAVLWYVVDRAARAEDEANQAAEQQRQAADKVRLEAALTLENALKDARHKEVAGALTVGEGLHEGIYTQNA